MIKTLKMNYLSDREISEGWTLMFDGETTGGWRTYLGSAPPSGWICSDGCLKCLGFGRTGGGDIVYDRGRFRDFHLHLEWKVPEAGNSGIFYMAEEIPDEPIWKTAFEMQILDNERHPDAGLGTDNNRQAGSLYDLIPAVPQNANPAGIWNTIEIVSQESKVIHVMNGIKVLEFEINNSHFRELVSKSKFSAFPEFGKYREGLIALQDHDTEVWFRNIKIKSIYRY